MSRVPLYRYKTYREPKANQVEEKPFSAQLPDDFIVKVVEQHSKASWKESEILLSRQSQCFFRKRVEDGEDTILVPEMQFAYGLKLKQEMERHHQGSTKMVVFFLLEAKQTL